MGALHETTFIGTARFQLISQLGEGAAGFVHKVRDRQRNAQLALKTLRTLSAENILLLKNEFRAIQDLNHPNLVRLYELFEERGHWFFTMEYVQGSSFTEYVRPTDDRKHPASQPVHFDEPKLRSALQQLASGLSAVHRSGKIHRDIKPSNVMVSDESRVVILDFGIVSDVNQQRPDDAMVGTAHYMAPEQVLSVGVCAASDWYAVGTMLYECLTGRLPFTGSMKSVLESKFVGEPASPDTLVEGLPRDLVSLCVDLLRFDTADRPSSEEILSRLGVRSAERESSVVAFVGRRSELDRLDQAFATVSAGQTVTVLVEGESGVGKSHLVREFTERVTRHKDVFSLRGRCHEREAVPYKALDRVVDELCHFLLSLPEQESKRTTIAFANPFSRRSIREHARIGTPGSLWPLSRRPHRTRRCWRRTGRGPATSGAPRGMP